MHMKKPFKALLGTALLATMLSATVQAQQTYSFQWIFKGLTPTQEELPETGWGINQNATEIAPAFHEVAYQFNLNNLLVPAGSGGATWTATGLPGWVNFNPTTGQLSGTPTATDSDTMITVSATINGVSQQATLRLPVSVVSDGYEGPWELNTDGDNLLPRAVIDQEYDYSLMDKVIPSDVPNITWAANNLPDWASLDPESGRLSGTPSGAHVGGSEIEFIATRQGEDQKAIYTIMVGDAILELTQLTGNGSSFCGLTTDSEVYCWGRNTDGNWQIAGTIGNFDKMLSETPVRVEGIPGNVVSVGLGSLYGCAETADARVYCWGSSPHGALGRGVMDDSQTAMPVPFPGSRLYGLSVSRTHSCAIMDGYQVSQTEVRDRVAVCWGSSTFGQTGNGERVRPPSGGSMAYPDTPAPHAVFMKDEDENFILMPEVQSVHAGGGYACGHLTDGRMMCWGNNTYSELTWGTFTRGWADYPMELGVVEQISTGARHACAVESNDVVKCWGSTQLVPGGSSVRNWTPVTVASLSGDVKKIHASFNSGSTCVITNAGTVKCIGTVSPQGGVMPGMESGVQDIAFGANEICMIKNGETLCKGRNNFGQLGNGTTIDTMDNRNNFGPVIPGN